MGRPPCCDKSNVKRGLWTAEEDAKILAYVANHGTGNWTSVPKKAGLKRCGKSCRLRYTNYLRPDIKRESFTPEEEEIIITLHATIGSRWSVIAQRLPGRTDNDVKNYWNTKLKKKLFQKGIDPITHRPISHILHSLGAASSSSSSSSLNHPRNLNRDLKSLFSTRRPDLASPPPTYDLLTQLHAIQLVTGRSNAPPPCRPSPAEEQQLSWSDFLVDDVVLCLQEDGDHRDTSDINGAGATDKVEEATSAHDASGNIDGEDESGIIWDGFGEEGFDFGDDEFAM